MTYEELVNKINNVENFSLARFGDGEFNAILGHGQPANCDGHRYFKDMGMRLYKIIKSQPKYIMGLQNLAQQLRKDDPNFHDLISGIDWVDSDIIHRASIKEGLHKLFDALKSRNIILVANVNLTGIQFEFNNNITLFNHIVISEKDCWLEYNDILTRIRANITKDCVILYCASMPTEILIDDVYNLVGDEVTQIDIGSAFDYYVGVDSRSYMRKMRE